MNICRLAGRMRRAITLKALSYAPAILDLLVMDTCVMVCETVIFFTG